MCHWFWFADSNKKHSTGNPWRRLVSNRTGALHCGWILAIQVIFSYCLECIEQLAWNVESTGSSNTLWAILHSRLLRGIDCLSCGQECNYDFMGHGGLVVVFGAEGRWFEPHSIRHIGRLGKFFTRSCLYDVMWRAVSQGSRLVAKFDSCNSLLFSIHTLPVNILRCIILYIKRNIIIIIIIIIINIKFSYIVLHQ